MWLRSKQDKKVSRLFALKSAVLLEALVWMLDASRQKLCWTQLTNFMRHNTNSRISVLSLAQYLSISSSWWKAKRLLSLDLLEVLNSYSRRTKSTTSRAGGSSPTRTLSMLTSLVEVLIKSNLRIASLLPALAQLQFQAYLVMENEFLILPMCLH